MRINWLGTILFMVGSLTLFSVTLLSEGGVSHIQGLRQALHHQQDKNYQLAEQIDSLKAEIVGIETDDRVLERIARERLVLARPDEAIIFFTNSNK